MRGGGGDNLIPSEPPLCNYGPCLGVVYANAHVYCGHSYAFLVRLGNKQKMIFILLVRLYVYHENGDCAWPLLHFRLST